MKAIVLAAGKGSRLGRLTDITPKPFLPLGGRLVVDYVMDNIQTNPEIDEVHMALSTRDYERISQRMTTDGYHGDIHMHPALGWETGGDMKSTAYEAGVADTFVQCFGDNVTKIDLEAMVDFHRKQDTLATVSLFEVTDEERSRMGIGRVEDGIVTEWEEKPEPHQVEGSNLANAGYYVFEPEVLEMIPHGKHKTERTAIPRLAEEGELAGFTFETPYWLDIGTPESYNQANKLILEEKGVIAPPLRNSTTE